MSEQSENQPLELSSQQTLPDSQILTTDGPGGEILTSEGPGDTILTGDGNQEPNAAFVNISGEGGEGAAFMDLDEQPKLDWEQKVEVAARAGYVAAGGTDFDSEPKGVKGLLLARANFYLKNLEAHPDQLFSVMGKTLGVEENSFYALSEAEQQKELAFAGAARTKA